MVQDIGCYMPGAIKVLHGLHERSLQEQGPHSNLTMYFAKQHSAYVNYLDEEKKGWGLEHITCSSSGQAYVDFLGDIAQKKSLQQAIIAFAPCTVLWDWLGGRMQSCLRQGNVYNEWIKRLAGSSKTGDFSLINSLMDQIQSSEAFQTAAVETFREGMLHEYRFFNSVIPGSLNEIPGFALETVTQVTQQSEDGPEALLCFLGLTYLVTLAWARMPRRRTVLNVEVQQALLK
eukprot:Skav234691  [mRNA]  locus=scaffold3643:156072:156767:- [translate_table: standard]